MIGKLLKTIILSLFLVNFGNSCSSGPDPDPIVLDIFLDPAKNCLQIHNVFNDLIMDVNGIAISNLDFEEDTIVEDVKDCMEALVYREEQTNVLDSIVLNYKTSYCQSHGGNFKGKATLLPINASDGLYEIRLSDFFANGYGISGIVTFQILGEADEYNFSVSLANGKFQKEGTEIFYTINVNETCKLLKNRNDEETYTDDLYELGVNLDGTTPDGAQFSLSSSSGLTYSYTCGEIIGGDTEFVLSDIGEAHIYYGGANPVTDCDSEVVLKTLGTSIVMKL